MVRRVTSCLVMLLVLALWAAPALGQESVPPQPPEEQPPPGPPVYVGIVDYRGGDDDGVPEPGERLEVFVKLVTKLDMTGVRGTLRSNTDGVTILTAQAAWPDIKSGEEQANTTPLAIQIGPDVPRNTGCEGAGPPQDPGFTEPEGSAIAEPDGSGNASSGEGEGPSQGAPPPPGNPDEPVSSGEVTPDEQTTVEPAPDQGGIQPAPAEDSSAAFELMLAVTADGYDVPSEQSIGNMVVCMYASGVEPAPGAPGAPDGESGFEDVKRTVTDERAAGAAKPSKGGAAVPVAAAGLVTVAALVVRYRFGR